MGPLACDLANRQGVSASLDLIAVLGVVFLSMTSEAEPMPDPSAPLYDRDFYAWAQEQAALLRAGRLAAADIEHIAEEIESMGRSEKRELVSRLAVLLAHLLKWRYQPACRGPSWEVTIRNQRRGLSRHLADNPSLKSKVPEAVADAYEDARASTYAETGLPEVTFPVECPWTSSDILRPDYWPEN